MNTEMLLFEEMRAHLCTADEHIQPGRMMSCPALCYRGRVFAFLTRNRAMVFKLGKEFSPQVYGCESLRPFNPFRTKGPPGGWFELEAEHCDQWEALCRKALDFCKTP